MMSHCSCMHKGFQEVNKEVKHGLAVKGKIRGGEAQPNRP